MAKHYGLWAGVVLACGMALPALAQDDAPTADTVVATVNGTEITLGELIILREKLPAQYQALPDDMLFKGLIDQAIQQTALEQSVADTATKRDELWMRTDQRSYLAGKALQAVVQAAVTDEALQKAYDEKYANAPAAKEYNAQHILVDSEEKANELKAQIDGGADFAELAKANSTDTGSAVNGGDLGWFGLGMMVAPFEEAVVAATPGTVTAPVKTDFGWHLIKVNEVRDATKPAIDEVRDELAAEIEQAAVEAHVTGLTGGAEITRPGEGLDPALLRDASLLDK
ncbi:peptidylprolyl isomerase [Rhodobacteraceae bacterium HSP-20]|uniref:Parvulin-like PPIase n=1 Tax=Paragemmobacter amnigenus TaxID=2852097 RepID=A0ABS6J3G6_9RHOB|nr:peptidylprolyl isomerase [Rhodobacter amnigenus]MBU9697997.1 peptidylprolyl isomerase [Rhodobacter amnigenus]MBV4389224.1 peptidylprolyl isomerase [Rhodobacter amnigenus]